MDSREGIENAVLAFVAAELDEENQRLRLSTRLYHDLGVDGEEAETFMEAFAERFRVDLSGFEFERHFRDEEAGGPLSRLWQRWRNPESGKRIPITLEDLVEAAREKRWRTPSHKPT
jgi:hypothetical protein